MNKDYKSKFEPLIDSGAAFWLEQNCQHDISKFFDSLPWTENRIDESKLTRSTIRLDLYNSNDQHIKDYLNRSILKKYKYVVFVFYDESPFLVSEYKFVANNFIEYLTYQGDAFAVGANDPNQKCFDDYISVYDWQALTFTENQ